MRLLSGRSALLAALVLLSVHARGAAAASDNIKVQTIFRLVGPCFKVPDQDIIDLIEKVMNPLTGVAWGNQVQSGGFKSLCDKLKEQGVADCDAQTSTDVPAATPGPSGEGGGAPPPLPLDAPPGDVGSSPGALYPPAPYAPGPMAAYPPPPPFASPSEGAPPASPKANTGVTNTENPFSSPAAGSSPSPSPASRSPLASPGVGQRSVTSGSEPAPPPPSSSARRPPPPAPREAPPSPPPPSPRRSSPAPQRRRRLLQDCTADSKWYLYLDVTNPADPSATAQKLEQLVQSGDFKTALDQTPLSASAVDILFLNVNGTTATPPPAPLDQFGPPPGDGSTYAPPTPYSPPVDLFPSTPSAPPSTPSGSPSGDSADSSGGDSSTGSKTTVIVAVIGGVVGAAVLAAAVSAIMMHNKRKAREKVNADLMVHRWRREREAANSYRNKLEGGTTRSFFDRAESIRQAREMANTDLKLDGARSFKSTSLSNSRSNLGLDRGKSWADRANGAPAPSAGVELPPAHDVEPDPLEVSEERSVLELDRERSVGPEVPPQEKKKGFFGLFRK